MNRIPLKSGLMKQKVLVRQQKLQGVHNSFERKDIKMTRGTFQHNKAQAPDITHIIMFLPTDSFWLSRTEIPFGSMRQIKTDSIHAIIIHLVTQKFHAPPCNYMSQ